MEKSGNHRVKNEVVRINLVWKDTLYYLRKEEKKKVCISTQRNSEVGGRNLRKIMFSLGFSEVRSFIETKSSMSRLLET